MRISGTAASQAPAARRVGWATPCLRTVNSEMQCESEEILEVGEPAWSRRRKVFADVIVSNEFAEAIAEIKLASNAQIDPDMRSEHRPGGGERNWRQIRRTT